MTDRIKMENIVGAFYNKQTGELYIKTVEEYVCSECRHLIDQGDKYCWQCGDKLEDKGALGHHGFGGELSHADYVEAMKMKPREAVEYIKRHTKKEG